MEMRAEIAKAKLDLVEWSIQLLGMVAAFVVFLLLIAAA